MGKKVFSKAEKVFLQNYRRSEKPDVLNYEQTLFMRCCFKQIESLKMSIFPFAQINSTKY